RGDRRYKHYWYYDVCISYLKRQIQMKIIILAALGIALLLPSQAQQKNKEYTNFNDSVFSINEVVVATNYRRKTDALKLDVPAKRAEERSGGDRDRERQTVE